MALARDVIENITSNTLHRYNCHELREELKEIIEKNNGKNCYIYLKLV